MSKIELRMDESEISAVREEKAELATQGVDIDVEVVQRTSGEGVEAQLIVEAILIGGAVLAVAQFLYGWWKRAQPGIVIDLREGAKENIYRDDDLPGHHIVVFAKDGTVTIEVKDEEKTATERLLEKVLDVVTKPVEAGKTLIDALTGALGDKAKVSEGATSGGEAKPA